MKKFGSWSEQTSTKFRTSSDNKEVSLLVPSTLSGASNSFTTPNITGTTDTFLSRVSLDTGASRLQNKDLSTDNILFVDNSDNTKKLQFSISGFSTSTTHVLTLPNITDTLVTETQTQTLTNKTIDADNNTLSNIDNNEIKAAAGILVNKLEALTASRALVTDGSGFNSVSTVTSTELAQLSGNTFGGTSAGDVVTIDDTQTLTNKTIDADNNTLSNIDNNEIKAAAGILVNKLEALTASRALVTDGSGFNSVSTVTSTELGYVSGVTSAIQTQINAKQADLITTRGDVLYGNASNIAARLALGAVGTVLTSDGTDVSWASPAGTGDVTSAANMTDNTLIKGDGGAKGVQDSGILLDDDDNFTAAQSVQFDSENTASFTVATSQSMTHSFMEVATATTITIDGKLGVIDSITVNGTGILTINGDCRIA
jgi:hypothetical protein